MEYAPELLQAIYLYMKFIISRYNHSMDWLKDYPEAEVTIYDRSEKPMEGSVVMPNIGSDWYDKFTYIIDNYDNLPEVAIYTKANLFDYISKEEFDKIKDNHTFTPLLTQHHKVYEPVCRYKDGMYYERNDMWYLGVHPTKHRMIPYELQEVLGIGGLEYIPFAPGSNYIVPKENILKHSKEFYQKLRSYLEWDRYPGEAQIIERGMYTVWL